MYCQGNELSQALIFTEPWATPGCCNGALGIEQTHLYGPEVGLLGLVLNSLFVAALWLSVSRRQATG